MSLSSFFFAFSKMVSSIPSRMNNSIYYKSFVYTVKWFQELLCINSVGLRGGGGLMCVSAIYKLLANIYRLAH